MTDTDLESQQQHQSIAPDSDNLKDSRSSVLPHQRRNNTPIGTTTSCESHDHATTGFAVGKTLYQGQQQLCCLGRALCGPDHQTLTCSLMLICTFCSMFLALVAPGFHWAVSACCGALALSAVVNLSCASFMDPGVLPRGDPNTPDPDHQTDTPMAEVNGKQVPLRWCRTCKIWRPPRAKHCSMCDHCVEEFDHHCPWVSNCIGRRNYRFFFLFVMSVTLLDVFVFVFSLWTLIREGSEPDSNFSAAIGEEPAAAFLVLMTILLGFCLGGLAGFHIYLVCAGMTTNEELTGVVGGSSKRSCVGNCAQALCSSIPPSKLTRRRPRGKHNRTHSHETHPPLPLSSAAVPLGPNRVSSSTTTSSHHQREHQAVPVVQVVRHVSDHDVTLHDSTEDADEAAVPV